MSAQTMAGPTVRMMVEAMVGRKDLKLAVWKAAWKDGGLGGDLAVLSDFETVDQRADGWVDG